MNTELIWYKHKHELQAFIRSGVKDRAAAEDILQETFIKIHLNLNTLKDKTRMRSWIYQIARNLVHDYYRKHRQLQSLEKAERGFAEAVSENEKFLECMAPFINKLPEKYREVIRLTDLQQVDQKQLAKRLNISYPGARSRVQRARKLLYSYFAKCCDIVADRYGNIVSHKSRGHCICEADGAC